MIGTCGNFSALQKLYTLEFPVTDNMGLDYVLKDALPVLRKNFKAGFWKKDLSNKFLIAKDRQLFGVEENTNVRCNSSGFQVMGSGSLFAAGALEALTQNYTFNLRESLKKAIQIASVFDTYTSDNVDIFVL